MHRHDFCEEPTMAEQDPVRALSVPTPGSTLLDDKYTTPTGRVYLTGYQALDAPADDPA
jgi:hypothetical protein